MTASIPPPSPAADPQPRPHRPRRPSTPIVVAVAVIGALVVAGGIVLLARSPGPPGAPGTPRATASTCGDPCSEIRPRVEVTWTAPSDGGEVTGYRVQRDGEPLPGAGAIDPASRRPDRRQRGARPDLHLPRHRVRRGGEFTPVLRGHRRDRTPRGRPRPTRRRLRRAPEGSFRSLVGRHVGHRPAGGRANATPTSGRSHRRAPPRTPPVPRRGRHRTASSGPMSGDGEGRSQARMPGAVAARRSRHRSRSICGPSTPPPRARSGGFDRSRAWSRSDSCARVSDRRRARSR